MSTSSVPQERRECEAVMEARVALNGVVYKLQRGDMPAAVFHLEQAIRAAKKARRELIPMLERDDEQ